ncbi:ABC transporter permease [Algimonas porphyrae]|uniref:Iron ABC transporter permease n=1 Tax=Algimonas porphyrae TaxID=1128113 RepID=A0ABQ5UY27_9PROT|nr:iron ABC transporter permease [Algimonas porphyrae]GLQ19463.1 iron ABC transporter permease [Algimonas porphyrae]
MSVLRLNPPIQLSPRRLVYRLSIYAIAALVALPLVTVLFALFAGESGVWSRLWATTLPVYVANSLLLMALTGLIATLIGVGTGWCVAMLTFPGRRWISWLLILPLAAPAYIVAYVYVELLDYFGPLQSALRSLTGWEQGDYAFPPLRTLPGAALILGLCLYPYVYLLARASFGQQSATQWQAARSLGANPFQAFRRVALPMARPAIIGGLALVLMETLADFGVADYFGIPTFSTGIFRSWLAAGDRPAAMKLAAVMLLCIFTLILMEASSRKGRVSARGRTMGQAGRLTLGRRAGWMVTLLCLCPVILGFAIPVVSLLHNVISVPDARPAGDFMTYAGNTVIIGITVVILSLLLAGCLAYANRRLTGRFSQAVIRFSTLGYALPGALLAVGLLIPIGGVDRAVTRFATTHLGWDGGLLLSGTIIVLVFALLIRFLTVSYNALSAGFNQIPPSMDAAARSLGASPAAVMRRIHLPLLRPSLLAGGLIVFVDTLRELPATLILRPFNFDTLATRIYWLASDERIVEASTAAMLVILCGLIPVILINRTFENQGG